MLKMTSQVLKFLHSSKTQKPNYLANETQTHLLYINSYHIANNNFLAEVTFKTGKCIQESMSLRASQIYNCTFWKHLYQVKLRHSPKESLNTKDFVRVCRVSTWSGKSRKVREVDIFWKKPGKNQGRKFLFMQFFNFIKKIIWRNVCSWIVYDNHFCMWGYYLHLD